MVSKPKPLRLFLDTGVIIEGCTSRWGASKLVLILAAQRDLYTVVFAAAVEQELQRNVAYTVAPLPPMVRDQTASDVAGWLRRARLERWPMPTQEQLVAAASTLMPVLRHANDLQAVVTAVQARPDWVISANRAHWGEDLAKRTGLRIVAPQDFVGRLRLLPDDD